MITARHQHLQQLFFRWYFRRLFKRQFSHFEGVLAETDPQKSVCWISNHSSWWDGVWPLLLNEKHEKRPFYVLMLEKELKKRPFLRALGSFSIAPGERSMAETGQYLASLLRQPENLVLLYPQGQLESMAETDIRFAPGMLRYACRENEHIQWLMSAFLVDYGASPKPTVFHYHQLKCYAGEVDAAVIERDYQHFYNSARQNHIIMLHMQHNTKSKP